MQNRMKATMLASALILGSSMVGCSGASMERRPALSASQGPVIAQRIEKALSSKDYAHALTEAERLVAAAPQEGAYRALLGRAYLANGRYFAAGASFSDAMTLGDSDPRTIISLALVQTGLGHAPRARALLADQIQNLPAADYGLAMALSGDANEGVRALLEAVQMQDATPKTRQNLAYALALSGDWEQARLVASRDVAAGDVQQRIVQWAQLAKPGAEHLRVVALLGVAPRLDDAGLPARLALNETVAKPVRQAAAGDLIQQAKADVAVERAADAESEVETSVASQQLASIEPNDALAEAGAPIAGHEAAEKGISSATLAAAFDTTAQTPTPLIHAPAEPMRQAIKTAFLKASGGSLERAKVNRLPAPVSADAASEWVVQLGAYDSKAVAVEKWEKIKRNKPGLKGFAVVNSTIDLHGRTFHRLAVRGFGGHSDALSLCANMRSRGQACFVRLDDRGDFRMAQATGSKKLAVR